MSIKLVSVNIEGRKHLDMVREFLAREDADVVCLMEVIEQDLPTLIPVYLHRVWHPNFFDLDGQKVGIAIVAKEKILEWEYFWGDGRDVDMIPSLERELPRPLLVKAIVGDFTIGAVHWTWTKDGVVNDKQRVDLGRLMDNLKGKELVLCGDFNLPRNLPGGNELYNDLTKIWQDNIPVEVVTTIDPDLHKANQHNRGSLKWMVDYVWTCLRRQGTPKYRVSEVRVESGVSDHCAIVCKIDKVIK